MYGKMILDELQVVMPSFVARVSRPERGGEWIEYLQTRAAHGRATGRAARSRRRPRAATHSVRRSRCCTSTATRRSCSPRCCSSPRTAASRRCVKRSPSSTIRRAGRCSPSSSASASNRRHRPGRGFEALRYRFEIVSDYGAFRDLQRHRMLTVQWQSLTPHLGAGVPEQVELAGCGEAYRRALEVSHDRVRAARRQRASSEPLPTRSASATGSGTSSTSTLARRCS